MVSLSVLVKTTPRISTRGRRCPGRLRLRCRCPKSGRGLRGFDSGPMQRTSNRYFPCLSLFLLDVERLIGLHNYEADQQQLTYVLGRDSAVAHRGMRVFTSQNRPEFRDIATGQVDRAGLLVTSGITTSATCRVVQSVPS